MGNFYGFCILGSFLLALWLSPLSRGTVRTTLSSSSSSTSLTITEDSRRNYMHLNECSLCIGSG
ncbi:hypothetical protein RchiOBHm_Chr3g0497271 [Rosa chinensis]|uniref:Secreted protein n=1 Tax=Rosa chinensis TaxID=74649 RepID=A0A2P6RHQ4_ROSCH|nr:hypothetical protein RchiOBHm_Chr3g0497271 [Rosa chinensis]